MASPFIAEITMFGGTFPPRGWAFCDGQLLPIAQYQALFALLGTTYGGRWTNNFRTARSARSCPNASWPGFRLAQSSSRPEGGC